MNSRRFAWTLLVAGLFPVEPLEAAPRTDSSARPAQSLLDQIGVGSIEKALRASDAHERERALTRLGAFGTARALDLLVRSLDANGAAQSSRERLIAVRMLAPYVRVASVRECLVRVMTGISAGAERAEPLQALLRDTAALALAASKDASALEALGKALRQPGRVAQAAAAALAAHPPEDLSALARAHYAPTIDLIRAFEELGDERAFELLRDIVRRASPELQTAAAVALTRLGDFETVALAQRWAKSEHSTLRVGALQIFLLARQKDAAALAGELLKDDELRPEVLSLLAATRDPALAPLLQKALATDDPYEKKSVIAALGANATHAAVQELGRLVQDPRVGDTAAYALANTPSESATDELEHLLAHPASARRAARAAIVRAYRRGEASSQLRSALEHFAKSAEPGARAVGVYGLSLFFKDRCVEFLKAKDSVAVQAAARAAPFVGAATYALERLSAEPPGPARTQLALALVDPNARRRVPVRTLLELVEEGSAAAPLALFALGERDSEETRPRLVEFASAPDALLRSAVHLGLGDSSTPSARSLLAANYLFEPDAEVRRAQVAALGRRRETSRLATLALAARLDPDARVREAARLASANVTSATFTSGRGSLWLALENPEPSSVAVAYVGVPGGLVLPAIADPDGIVLLAGLPEGKLSLRLALEPRERKAPAEERSHATFQR